MSGNWLRSLTLLLTGISVLLGSCTPGAATPVGSTLATVPPPAATPSSMSTAPPLPVTPPVPDLTATRMPSRHTDAWAAAASALPVETPIYRPTWLPARFQQAPELWYAEDRGGDIGPIYLVGYRSSSGDVLHFALGAVNTAPPDTIESVTVRGVEGTLVTTSSWPKIGISWQERPRVYHVQGGDNITREEMMRIVESLALVER